MTQVRVPEAQWTQIQSEVSGLVGKEQRGSFLVKSSFTDPFIQQIIVDSLPCAKHYS